MALLTSEVQRLRVELGYNALTIGALPYIGHAAIFEQVIQPYLEAGATTTSATAVVAATTPTLATLVLVSAVGFTAGDQVVVDVDSLQEVATVRSLSGSSIGVLLSKAHAGTYPVTVDGGETIVREYLAKLKDNRARLLSAGAKAGLKRAEEIEWYPGAIFVELRSARNDLRDELGSVVGLANMHRAKSGSGASALY